MNLYSFNFVQFTFLTITLILSHFLMIFRYVLTEWYFLFWICSNRVVFFIFDMFRQWYFLFLICSDSDIFYFDMFRQSGIFYFWYVPTEWYFLYVPTVVFFIFDMVRQSGIFDMFRQWYFFYFWYVPTEWYFLICSDSGIFLFLICSDRVVFFIFHFIYPFIFSRQIDCYCNSTFLT
jgi:hypothetical protein